MARQNIEIFKNKSFGVVHDIDENPTLVQTFSIHNHEDIYEVLLLLKGDCEFYVEGNSYYLSSGDLVFARPQELHRMFFLSEKTYERIILYVHSNYFSEHHCEHLKSIFEGRELGCSNHIAYRSDIHPLKDCMERLYLYSHLKEYDLAEHIVYELLYLMNFHKDNTSSYFVKNEHVRSIIIYINDHITEPLSLDTLAQNFFLAKQYMCKIFHLCTGQTINYYITYKRLLLVQELHRNGQTLLQASLNAGFNSYANFYKAYVKFMKQPPSKMD